MLGERHFLHELNVRFTREIRDVPLGMRWIRRCYDMSELTVVDFARAGLFPREIRREPRNRREHLAAARIDQLYGASIPDNEKLVAGTAAKMPWKGTDRAVRQLDGARLESGDGPLRL